MIVRPPVAEASRTVLGACIVLERASRWSACLSAIASGAGPGAAAVADLLRQRLFRVREAMQPVWPVAIADLAVATESGTATGMQPGTSPGTSSGKPAVDRLPSPGSTASGQAAGEREGKGAGRVAAESGVRETGVVSRAEAAQGLEGALAELMHLERALRKLPGPIVRSETYGLLEELGPRGARIPPVVLDSEDQDRDEDGFLSLPIVQVAAPLAWPRLAFGLAAARDPRSGTQAWDRQASRWLGPSYLFVLIDRAASLPEVPADLAARIAAVCSDLAARDLLVPEAVCAVAALGGEASRAAESLARGGRRASVPGRAGDAWTSPEHTRDGASMPSQSEDSAFGPDDLASAEAAAERLADGVLAGARPTADRQSVRAARERLLADPAGGPEAVYAALEGLREEPLSGAQILAGGWLHLARSREAWLQRSLAAPDPFAAYGEEILRLDSLVLKSLETAGVHRRLVLA